MTTNDNNNNNKKFFTKILKLVSLIIKKLIAFIKKLITTNKNKEKTNKEKKKRGLFSKLIVIVSLILLVISVAYVIYIQYYPKTGINNNIHINKAQKEHQFTQIQTLDQNNISEKNDDNERLKYEEQITYLNTQNTQLKEQNNELENIAKSLQLRIENIKDIDHTFVIYHYLLIKKLKTNLPFKNELEDTINATNDLLMKEKLEKLRIYSRFGVPSNEDLIRQYQEIFQETYTKYLKNQPELTSKIYGYFNSLFFIKKNNDRVIAIDSSNNVKIPLMNTELYMQQNDFRNAYNEFMKVDIVPSERTQKWISNILERIEVNEVLYEIEDTLTKYTEVENT